MNNHEITSTYTFINDLQPLCDVIDKLTFEEPILFNEDNVNEFIETLLILIDECLAVNPTMISEPDFNELLFDDVKELLDIQMEDHLITNEFTEEDMDELIQSAINIYLEFSENRSLKSEKNVSEQCEHNQCPYEIKKSENEKKEMELKINKLKQIPQPIQKTKEWYEFRWNLITASNAWKAFGTEKAVNQLIYEKCQPLTFHNEKEETVTIVNTNTPLHWGQKYEPLSVMLYEHLYDSTVHDFGCIQHPKYYFIGASPDGIVVRSNTGRFGRMLEIKNVVSRTITGIPKKEYWIQMQLQMEVCDLDECDFLETKFVEYSDYNSFQEDSNEELTETDGLFTKQGQRKGIIIHFHTKEGRPFYEYMPLSFTHKKEILEWQEMMLDKYEQEPYNYVFLKFIYWKLDTLSCVLVLRNKQWFESNVEQLEKVWKTIEQERITGCEHRAPTKKVKKENDSPTIMEAFNCQEKEECFLKVVQLTKSIS
jgi:putative phage-type endonuclease